mgnify:CR=1 FL=1
MSSSDLPADMLSSRIQRIRNVRVMLDADLAELYGVPTKVFNQAVKRNLSRFHEEFVALRSQFATSNEGRGGRRYLPYVFTEHGAIMAATILNSQRAVDMSVFVVRAFVEYRQLMTLHDELAVQLNRLEGKVATHDKTLTGVLDAIRQLMTPPEPKKRGIGFLARE